MTLLLDKDRIVNFREREMKEASAMPLRPLFFPLTTFLRGNVYSEKTCGVPSFAGKKDHPAEELQVLPIQAGSSGIYYNRLSFRWEQNKESGKMG
jgi:hypothetical protein